MAILFSFDGAIDENNEQESLLSNVHPNVDSRLRTSQTANSLLGLSILLNGNKREYQNTLAVIWNLNKKIGFFLEYLKKYMTMKATNTSLDFRGNFEEVMFLKNS